MAKFCLIVFAVMIAIFQPYKADFAVYNIVDTVFILILALWYCTVMCIGFASLKDHRYKYTSILGSVVVALLPLFYITAITLRWVCSQTRIGPKMFRKIQGWIQHQPPLQLQGVNDEDSLPHRFANPEQYRNTLEDPVTAGMNSNSSCSDDNSSDNETAY